MKKSYLTYPYVLWIIIFTIIPLLLIFYYAFVTSTPSGIEFSMVYFLKIFEWTYLKTFLLSMGLALLCTLICFILGYPLAYILSRSRSTSTVLIFLFILPMWMNFLLRTYAWLSLLGKNGLLNQLLTLLHLPNIHILYTYHAVVLGMVYNFLPFMVLPIYTVLKKMDYSLIEAAQDLGANKTRVFREIIWPLSIPGVISGISMVFMPAVTTFVIPRLLGGNKTNLIGNIIEQQFIVSDNWQFGSSLSIILMVIILITMSIINKYGKQQEGGGLW